ncbi:hypothetical protein RYB07_12240, partial [Pseudomonas syringae pv. actinidifoliorum]|nr:hypothetical protein [Pseudomonas syringae pv. actinidifoliorum]
LTICPARRFFCRPRAHRQLWAPSHSGTVLRFDRKETGDTIAARASRRHLMGLRQAISQKSFKS